ncbi:hypothetical protein Adt_29713 [Abeliophyllum distichum]|uniref:Uncharacterized protein n=1 Tax=Abeliophyllum distichum TaxID=126358 RepID=A0ABD1RA90_9LAMI
MMRIPVWGFRVVRAMGSGGECYLPNNGCGPLCDRGNRPENSFVRPENRPEFALCNGNRPEARCNGNRPEARCNGNRPDSCSVEAKVKEGVCSVEAKVKQVDGDGGRRCS